jgi:hypothetical protein
VVTTNSVIIRSNVHRHLFVREDGYLDSCGTKKGHRQNQKEHEYATLSSLSFAEPEIVLVSLMKPVRKSAKQIRSEILEAAQAAERDARAFNKLLVSLDPRVNKTERTIHMGLVWQFVAEYKRKMILLNGAAAVQDVRKLHTELVREQQQLQKIGSDGVELLRQFNLRWAVVIDD